MRASIITDEMEVLSVGGCDAERLLHEPVWLVSVTIRSFFGVHIAIVSTISATVRSLSSSGGDWWCKPASAPLALHFSVRQETARDSTCTPALAICPSSHASFPLVPDKDGA